MFCSISSSSDSTFRTFDLVSVMITSSKIHFLFDALTYLPPSPLSLYFFGDLSFVGDLWNLFGVDINCRCNFFKTCSMDRMFDTIYVMSRWFSKFLFQYFSLVFFSRKVYGFWKFPLIGFTHLHLGDFSDLQHGIFLFLAMNMWFWSLKSNRLYRNLLQ